MASPKLIDTDGLTVFKDECDKAYLPKVTLSAVATSGSYTDLSNKPTIPTALKNPNALTFTGAVTGSYDGSAAKSVNIPAAQDLTPYMKKIADSDLDMRGNKLKFATGTISYGFLEGQRTGLIIDASNSEGVNIKAPSVLVNESPIATKTDLSKCVKSINNLTPDSSGNVNISTSGGGSNVTVDTTLSATSTNAIANKAVYAALSDKLGKSDVAIGAQRALQDGDGNIISLTYVKSVNGAKPDSKGNVSISASGGGGASTSTQNTWTAQQSFDLVLLDVEKYKTSYDNGNSVKPSKVTAVYNATGSFTLDLTNFSYLLNIGQSLVFTAYIKANADYPLTITNGGTLKYTGNPSDLAITSAGLLLNIFITLDNSGNKTSIVQASKLS